MAELTGSAADDRPFPPGDYPVVVIGSGPGGLQVSYSLRRLGHRPRGDLRGSGAGRHVPALAVLPAAAVVDEAPRPGAARLARVRALRLEQPARRRARDARAPARVHGRHLVLPVAAGDGGEPRAVRRAGAASRSATAAAGRRRAGRGRPDGRAVRRRDDRRRVPRRERSSSRSASPSRARRPGRAWSSPATTPTSGRPRRTPASGCSSSASRTRASSWRTGCCRGPASSCSRRRRRRRLSVETRSLVGVRARYVQPYEDHVLGGGVADPRRGDRPHRARPRAATARSTVHAAADRRRRRPRRRGRRGHLGDRLRLPARWTCPSSASRRSGPSRLPAQTPWWESTTRARASTSRARSGRARRASSEHGMPSNSGAVHGARYNARLLAARIADDPLRRSRRPRPPVAAARPRGPRRDRAGRGARAVAPARLPRPRRSRSTRTPGSSTTASSR